MDRFDEARIDTGETTIYLRRAGRGPPLLLLHGFPETHLMWRGIAPALASEFTVVCADLRGHGRSACPASDTDHASYSKRALARDMLRVMEILGFGAFSVAGHDRGGRVAYRLALDHPGRVTRLAVLDIIPTESAWARADARFALSFWPWSLLAQPAPLPERLLTGAPEAVVEHALNAWGTPEATFPASIRAAYVDALRDPEHARAICEEYRAAATIDRLHDQQDLSQGRKIVCPVLVLWSSAGGLNTWYEREGGPLALWKPWCTDVTGHGVPGGHFFPEEQPERTAELLRRFFTAGN
jgi:haloacetate dehalogenase